MKPAASWNHTQKLPPPIPPQLPSTHHCRPLHWPHGSGCWQPGPYPSPLPQLQVSPPDNSQPKQSPLSPSEFFPSDKNHPSSSQLGLITAGLAQCSLRVKFPCCRCWMQVSISLTILLKISFSWETTALLLQMKFLLPKYCEYESIHFPSMAGFILSRLSDWLCEQRDEDTVLFMD